MFKLFRIAQYLDKIGKYKISDSLFVKASLEYMSMREIAEQVRNMHPYDFSTHFDLIEDLNKQNKLNSGHSDRDIASKIINNQKTFDIYEDLYPSIQVFPGQATWHYNIKDPSDLSGLTGNGWKQNKNTDVSVEDDVSVAVEKLHREYPEALIDYYYEEFI